jgi:hypothetical protein
MPDFHKVALVLSVFWISLLQNPGLGRAAFQSFDRRRRCTTRLYQCIWFNVSLRRSAGSRALPQLNVANEPSNVDIFRAAFVMNVRLPLNSSTIEAEQTGLR